MSTGYESWHTGGTLEITQKGSEYWATRELLPRELAERSGSEWWAQLKSWSCWRAWWIHRLHPSSHKFHTPFLVSLSNPSNDTSRDACKPSREARWEMRQCLCHMMQSPFVRKAAADHSWIRCFKRCTDCRARMSSWQNSSFSLLVV